MRTRGDNKGKEAGCGGWQGISGSTGQEERRRGLTSLVAMVANNAVSTDDLLRTDPYSIIGSSYFRDKMGAKSAQNFQIDSVF
jgi:hypothetical protein